MTHKAASPCQAGRSRLGPATAPRGLGAFAVAVALLLHIAICATLIWAARQPEAPRAPDDRTVAMVFAAPAPPEQAASEPPPEPALEQPGPEATSTPDAPPPPADKTATDGPPRRPSVAPPRKSPPARTVATPATAPSALPSGQPVQAPQEQEPAIAVDWQRSLGSWLEAHKSYPYEARRRGTEGRVALRFTVERSGRVMAVAVVSSAGSLILDDAAEALIRNATLPPFTAGMSQAQVTVTVQIRYALAN